VGAADIRRYLSLAACALAACGGDVDGTRQSTSSARGAGTGGSADGGGGTGGIAGAAGAGGAPEWTVWPGQTWAATHCDEQGKKDLLIELWSSAEAECVPPASVGDVAVLGLEDWDGTPGTFVFWEQTEHGRAGGSLGLSGGQPNGWLTIEPYRDTPGWVEWEMGGVPGRTDLSVCGQWQDFECTGP
jgi:hypothetical protein